MSIDLSGLITAEDKLDAAKRAQKDAINRARDAAIAAGVEYGGHVYDSDHVSVQRVMGVVQGVTNGIFELPPDYTWRTKDNQDVPFGIDDAKALGAVLMSHESAVMQQSWDLKATIDRKRSIAGVQSVVWPSA